ncbi:flagellar protein FliT [Paenibacillus pini]|uniref:Flagellar protein FliT n=1 Tax=Paenibacillus pini JCM 16418 TaxID=1236976 RepID=W7Z8F6_9BACL|nr:flagellar protein FliT [Paenibacillus pini]GAF10699.1 hypothetical protein JCM16418_4918 [Paenibacillus pini JCM 16418]
MDNVIDQLEEITQSIMVSLSHSSFEDLENFVEERQRIIDHINHLKLEKPITSEQFIRLQEILKCDPLILDKMLELKNEASNWLQQRGQAKVRSHAYEMVYTPDSILMDKKN